MFVNEIWRQAIQYQPCRLGSCRDRGHRRLAVKAGTEASEERREEQWDERRERRRLRAASVPTEPSMEGLPFQNGTLEPQQAVQLNQWLNLGADSIISRDRRMPKALWCGRTDGQVTTKFLGWIDCPIFFAMGFCSHAPCACLELRYKSFTLTLGRTRKVIPPQRGSALGFWYVAVFQNDFAFSRKPLILSTRRGIVYGWWRCWRSVTSRNMVAILDFIKN